MPVPKKRTTKSRQKKRRSQIFLKKLNLVLCDHCKKLKLPHRVCPHCGFYRGEKIIDVLKKIKDKKERKEKEKELKKQELDLRKLSKKQI